MIERGTVNISTGIVLRTILIVLGLVFLFYIRDIIAMVFVSIIIVAAIDPVVTFLQKKGVHRTLGVSLVYVVIFLLLGLFFYFVVPPMISQTKDVTQKIPEYLNNIGSTFDWLNGYFQSQHISLSANEIITEVNHGPFSISDNLFATTLGIFSGITTFVIVMVITFYMAMHENGIKNFLVSLSPEKHKKYVASLTDRINSKIGRWMLGQLLLMLIIFIMDLVGLLALHVPYAFLLAIFAGLMEIIPFIGPIVAAVPAVIMGFTVSSLTGFSVLALFTLVQQFEGHIIIPQVMKKAVGLHPIAIILALLIGFKLGGVFGAIISVPVATAASIFVGDLFGKEN